MKNYKQFLIGLAVGILLSIAIPKFFAGGDDNSKTTIDSTYVDTKVVIPTIKLDTVVTDPEPILVVETPYIQPKLEEFKKVKEDTIKEELYKVAITTRVYENTYSDKDSIATITVRDSVEGFLREQSISFNVKERPIEYKKYTITKTIKQRPVFALSIGVVVRHSNDYQANNSIAGILGLRGRRGVEFTVGYDTNRYVTVGLKKDLLTLYK
jgi:hypothetical protein